jgi:hypothetical protein
MSMRNNRDIEEQQQQQKKKAANSIFYVLSYYITFEMPIVIIIDLSHAIYLVDNTKKWNLKLKGEAIAAKHSEQKLIEMIYTTQKTNHFFQKYALYSDLSSYNG